MADNIELDSGSGGAITAGASLSFSGDTAVFQIEAGTILAGSEGSWTQTLIVGGAGAVTGGVQRLTLASDDPAVVALEKIDDWDESDRAKVNIIVGQAGVAAGAGAVGGTVPRVTLASNDPAVALLATIDVDTSKITACNTGAVVLATGSAAIGKLAANTGVDIGDVDVTSVVPGTAATNLGKARASALGATDTGVAVLAVRNDDLGDLAGADGGYTPLQVDNRGALFVNQAAAEVKQASGVAAGGAPGTDNMIAAVGGKKLLVLALSLFATSTTTNTVYVDNDDNDLLGNSGNGIALSLDADGDTVPGFILPYNPGGWFKTDTVNEAVTLNTSAAQDIIWAVTYIETD